MSLKNAQAGVAREALSGRLPIAGGERIYTKYFAFLWTCTAFVVATWSFLVGSQLPYVGDTKLGILGYICGYLVSSALVILAAGMPSYRYGVDTIDAVKSSFGRYGVVLPLFVLLAALVGWTYVLVAMTARGAGNVIQTARDNGGQTPEWLITVIGIAVVVMVWLIASKGPRLFERLNNWVGPGVIVLAAVMLGVLLWKFGPRELLTNVPAAEAYTQDKVMAFAYAAEFGVASGLSWLIVVGALTRHVRSRGHVVGPLMIGGGLLGGKLIVAIAAFGAVTAGTADPTIWMIQLGGSVVGSLSMAVIMVANMATMVVMIYTAGVAIQQVKLFARLPRVVVIGLLTLPGILIAFNTEWLLSKVMVWLSYNGLVFAGILGVMFVDYFVLRRQRLDIAHLYAHSAKAKYWFWGGVNWVAVVVTAASVWFYLWMYNPITLETQLIFALLGAGLPTALLSAFAYYLLSKLITVPLGKGGYPTRSEVAGAVQTTDEDALQELRVGL
jgi:NCS1 family nucleobase:cation symporter-1